MRPAKLLTAWMAIAVYIICGCASRNNPSSNNSPKETLGEIKFEVTGKTEAQSFFKKGLLYLHSFEYDDAAEEFQKAKQTDPDFVMAYWGEAMTHTHPLWREQDLDQARTILKNLAPTPEGRIAKAKNGLEKDFIKGADILYGKGNKAERDSMYAAYMQTLYKKYPGNNEVTSFYSLSLIGWGMEGRQTKIFELAASIAHEVLISNPRHPGALHYIIHAYDDPDHAAMALAIANKYALVAPDAGHALHMPTHTYLALGLWEKVINSNVISWAAEKERKERKNLNNDALGYHSYHWLQYGYLQKGKDETARKMVDSMQQYCNALPSARARAHMIFLKTTYLAETNDYASTVSNISVAQKDLNLLTRARNYFVNGMHAYYNNQADSIAHFIRQIAGERLIDEEKVTDKGIRICGNINRSIPTLTDLQKAEVMELELKAMEAWMKRDTVSTERLFKLSTEMELKSAYAYGPPTVVKPSFEMYGEWLLHINKPKEALEQFNQSLKIAPNKLLSVKGKESSLKKI